MEIAALIIIGVLLFELIILSHEFGHFITAKMSGVKVNEFALGMGPKLLKFQKGETLYTLRAFPIGGFCAMEGEDEESDSDRAFGNKAVWKRMIIVIAGATMNIILGLLLMFVVVVQQPQYTSTTVSVLDKDNVSHTSGLKVGDKFYSIDGYRTYTARDMEFALSTTKTLTPEIKVVRNGQTVDLGNVKFPVKTDSTTKKKSFYIDFHVQPIQRNVLTVITQTGADSVSVVRMLWTTLGGMISGQYGLNDISGPVGAASAVSQAAGAGLASSTNFWHAFLAALNNIILMMMLISINLGIVNMLPVPALDGGRFFFLLVELIFRKPIPKKYEAYVHAAGLVLLLGFMVLITVSDIARLFNGKGLFG
ncbi:MAG: site-2 protease family protein [Bacillota bacterium]|nr:site-2 protease family protein [Bacillota bacterium]